MNCLNPRGPEIVSYKRIILLWRRMNCITISIIQNNKFYIVYTLRFKHYTCGEKHDRVYDLSF